MSLIRIGLINDMLWGLFHPQSVVVSHCCRDPYFWSSVLSVGLDNEDPLKGGDSGRVARHFICSIFL